MTRRKGEITKDGIDRDYPHQVSMPVTVLHGSGGVVIQRFLTDMSVCRRHHSYYVHEPDGSSSEHIVYCFKDKMEAEYFSTHIGAVISMYWHGQKLELITIEERKRRQKAQYLAAKMRGM